MTTPRIIFTIGLVLGGLAVSSIVFIFVFLILKQERLKKLPVWVYIIAAITLVAALASIGLIIYGGVQAN